MQPACTHTGACTRYVQMEENCSKATAGCLQAVLESFGEGFQDAVKGVWSAKVKARSGRGDGVGQFFRIAAVISEKKQKMKSSNKLQVPHTN